MSSEDRVFAHPSPYPRSPAYAAPSPKAPSTLADLLERVLDKGVVVAGDIVVKLLDIELLTLKIRLLIASADTAREMGIDWWTNDPFLSSSAANYSADGTTDSAEPTARVGPGGTGSGGPGELGQGDVEQLHARIDRLEDLLEELIGARRGEGPRSDLHAGSVGNASPGLGGGGQDR